MSLALKDYPSRSLKVVGAGEGRIINFSKHTAVHLNDLFVHFDELHDGTWRLTYNAKLFPNHSKIVRYRAIGFNKYQGRKCEGIALAVEGGDRIFEIGKIVVVPKVDPRRSSTSIPESCKSRIHLDQASNGQWRLLYTEDMIREIKNLESFDFIRI